MTDPAAGETGAGQTSHQQRLTTGEGKKKTIIIGLSGPSSSGKTTFARLLKTIFSVDRRVRTFIIHEDDFYYPDDKIPVTRTKTGELVQDWDTVGAIDVAFLSATLAYVRQQGTLPPRLRSKEDQNDASDSGVDSLKVDTLRRQVGERLIKQQEQFGNTAADGKYTAEEATEAGASLTIAFLDGFLLYAPPESEAPQHVLRPIHKNIHLHLFFPAPYELVKSRREARSGYVTIGPAPTPKVPQDSEEQQHQQQQQQLQETIVDLDNADHNNPEQNFWTDPPGYVDDIVWPRYVQDHAWLLLPGDNNGTNKKPLSQVARERAKDSDSTTPDDELLKLAGDGTNVRTDAGVTVAPGKGRLPITEVLDWAVREVLRCLEVEDVA